jgi:hypothetical protein
MLCCELALCQCVWCGSFEFARLGTTAGKLLANACPSCAPHPQADFRHDAVYTPVGHSIDIVIFRVADRLSLPTAGAALIVAGRGG